MRGLMVHRLKIGSGVGLEVVCWASKHGTSDPLSMGVGQVVVESSDAKLVSADLTW